MKKALLAVSIIAMALPVVATEPEKEDPVKFCSAIASLAGQIMRARQEEVDVTEVYEMFRDDKLVLGIVKLAYSSTLYNTKKHQDRSISEFKKEHFLSCLEVRGKK